MSKKEIQAMEAQLAVHEIFGQFRYLKTDDGEIWFMAADICKILGLKNPTKSVKSLKENEKANFKLGNYGKPGNPNVLCVNEPGLYRLIFRSRKPEAERFQDWVYHEVLPSIRATGSYSLPKKKEVRKISTHDVIKAVFEKYPDAEPEITGISFSEDENGHIITHYHFDYMLPDGTIIKPEDVEL